MGKKSDKEMQQELEGGLKAIGLSPEAVDWLCCLWVLIQLADDAADRDKPSSPELVLHMALVDMPQHPFFKEHASTLLPLLSNAIIAWGAANRYEAGLERTKTMDAMAFSWRMRFYDIVMACIKIQFGIADAINHSSEAIFLLCGEDYDEWKEEVG